MTEQETIRKELAEKMGWDITRRQLGDVYVWNDPTGNPRPRLPDPFTNNDDYMVLKSWAWDRGIVFNLWPLTPIMVRVHCKDYEGKPIVRSNTIVGHDGSGKDMVRALREAVTRAIHAAVCGKEAKDE